MSFAVIQTGGKQYLVSKGDTVTIEKLNNKEGETVSFEVVALGDEKALHVTGDIKGASVKGSVLSHGRHKKVTGIKFKNKTRSKKSFGHRQHQTKVTITSITKK